MPGQGALLLTPVRRFTGGWAGLFLANAGGVSLNERNRSFLPRFGRTAGEFDAIRARTRRKDRRKAA